MPQKRDNAFYARHLRKNYPDLYRRWKDGEFPTLRRALIAAGVKRQETALDLLKRGWKKASHTDRKRFVRSNWLTLSELVSEAEREVDTSINSVSKPRSRCYKSS